MPADPFLSAHQLAPRLYSVGGKLYPVSVRDQFVRGEMLIQRAYEQGLIGPTRDPVVVVGAGAAGVAAAVRAAREFHCRVVLVEARASAFHVQAGCPQRRIDPTMYDFPALHWAADTFPAVRSAAAPAWRIQWRAEMAHILALAWRRELHLHLRAAEHLTFMTQARLIGPPVVREDGTAVDAVIRVARPNSQSTEDLPIRASIVVVASGFGPERRYLRERAVPGRAAPPPHPTWGYAFWKDDPLADANLGLATGTAPKVLISGSGDGALQDFLRVVTNCRTTREIYDAIFVQGEVGLRHRQLHSLHDATDKALRSYTWGLNAGHDHGALDTLHDVQLKIVAQLFRDRAESLIPALKRIVLANADLPTVRILHDCRHFSNCYGLNRFLTLIVAKYLRMAQSKRIRFMPGKRVLAIRSLDGHACTSDPDGCHGMLHEVTWGEIADCRDAAPPAKTGTLKANVLIIRHGIDTADWPWDPTPPFARQMLPYSPPDP